MIHPNSARERRRFYLQRGLRKRPIGSGSDLLRLMALPRSAPMLDPIRLFLDIPVLVCGGVATRAYMPERFTKDIDCLLPHDRFGDGRDRLLGAGFTYDKDLAFPSSTLGLYGEAWHRGSEEIDILSSAQDWCVRAFEEDVRDQSGLRVVSLPYLVLMKFDAARGVDQGDLTRMLGTLDDDALMHVIEVVQRYANDPDAPQELAQYAQLGRWEYGNLDA